VSVWRLRTHCPAHVAASEADVAAAAMLAPVVHVDSFDGAHANVRAGALVGVAMRNDLRVEVNAGSLSRSALLAMAGLHGRFVLQGDLTSDAPDADLLTVVARAFCDAMARLLSRGLVREYVEREGRFDTIRGEVVIDRWFGPNSPDGGNPLCRVRERTLDNPEHQMLGWALRAVAGEALLSKMTRSRASALTARMDASPLVTPGAAQVQRLRRTGLFSPYSEALDLAEILWLGVTAGDSGERKARGFLLDADRLYERWVLGMIRSGLPAGWSAAGSEGWSLTEGSDRLWRVMDTVVYDEDRRRVAIVDAKNKNLAEGAPDRDDVHQLVSYMATTGCGVGYLVGVGGPGKVVRRRWKLQNRLGEVIVIALPGGAEFQRLEALAGSWWRGEVPILDERKDMGRTGRGWVVESEPTFRHKVRGHGDA